MRRHVEDGLQRGAVGVGLGIQYTPGAARWEILEMFRAAAKHEAPCYVHIRHAGDRAQQTSMVALEEVVAASAITGASLHVVHVSSMGLRNTPRLLKVIAEARSRGLDITTECYPYTASMSAIRSAIFDEGWQDALGVTYGDLQWVATGERLTAESFARYQEVGGLVIIHSMPETMVRETVANPLTMIASDGFLESGKGHPRSSGTYARVLGRYVREQGALSWIEAIRKMTILPAQRLEHRVPMMKNKGRLQAGADADLVVFDPQTVIDRSTFERPAEYSAGFRLVLVGGTAVVKEGQLENAVASGQAIRAPLP
jgi:dihydroorotase